MQFVLFFSNELLSIVHSQLLFDRLITFAISGSPIEGVKTFKFINPEIIPLLK